MKLDFSEFHPLDHRPFDSYCRTLPGGGRRHLHLAWYFHRREQVLSPLYKLLLCPLGRHAEQVWYQRQEGETMKIRPVCRYCDWTRLPSEKDVDGADGLPL